MGHPTPLTSVGAPGMSGSKVGTLPGPLKPLSGGWSVPAPHPSTCPNTPLCDAPPNSLPQDSSSPPFLPGHSPGLVLAGGVGAISPTPVEGPGRVPAGGVGSEGKGQCPGPSSAPSGQSQIPSHSRMAPTHEPSTQDSSPGVQFSCPAAGEKRKLVPGPCPLSLLFGVPHSHISRCQLLSRNLNFRGRRGGRKFGAHKSGLVGGGAWWTGVLNETTHPDRPPHQQHLDSRDARHRAGPGAGSAHPCKPGSHGGKGSSAHPSRLHSRPARHSAGPGAGSGRSGKTSGPPHSLAWHSLAWGKQAGSG